MAQHLVTVCVVCVLCAAHTPCYAHMDAAAAATAGKETTTPSAEYPTELPRYNEHSLPDRIDSTKVPHWRSVGRKSSEEAENLKNLFGEVPDKTIEVPRDDDDRLADDLEHIQEHLDARQIELLERLGQNDLETRNDSKTNRENAKNSRSKRNSRLDEKYFTKKIFEMYGDGENMTMEGFEKLLKKMGLFQSESAVSEEEIHSIDSNQSGSRLGNHVFCFKRI